MINNMWNMMAHTPHNTTFQERNIKPCQTTMSYNRLLNETDQAGERMLSGVKLITHCCLV